MTAPLFTVVIPTRNRARLLSRALRSVLTQTFREFELIVVDDGSTDETPAILQALGDPRCRVLRREVSSGAGASRNAGFKAGSAPYVAFLDDDDEYLPDLLAASATALASAPPEVGFVWSGVEVVRDGATSDMWTPAGHIRWRPPSWPDRETAYRRMLLHRQVGTNCGLVVKREWFARVDGFDETLPCAEDTDLLARLSRVCDPLVVERDLVRVHLHGGPRLTRYDGRMAGAYERLIESHRHALEVDPPLAAEMHYKAGWLRCHGGEVERGRVHLLTALRHRPTHPRALALLALTVLGPVRLVRLHGRASSWLSRASSLLRREWVRP